MLERNPPARDSQAFKQQKGPDPYAPFFAVLQFGNRLLRCLGRPRLVAGRVQQVIQIFKKHEVHVLLAEAIISDVHNQDHQQQASDHRQRYVQSRPVPAIYLGRFTQSRGRDGEQNAENGRDGNDACRADHISHKTSAQCSHQKAGGRPLQCGGLRKQK